MKKRFTLIIAVLLTLSLVIAGCSGGDKKAETPAPAADANKKVALKIGATPVPHVEILNIVKPMLAKENIDLQIIEMNDYVRPNVALAEKELDANFFQHIPYLEKFSAERNLKLAYTAAVHIEPMGVYSKKIKDLKEITDNSQVGIPNDPTNGGRALMLLEKAGLIKLKDGIGINATVKDIADNPKALKIHELEAPQLPRSLDDVTIAVINTNYALEAKLSPLSDALFIEQKDSPYVNILAIREGDDKRPEIAKLTQALTSPEVKKFIEEKYKGAIVAAF